MEAFTVKTEKSRELILKTKGETQKKTVVHSDVSKYLKDHQVDGIKFLFENCFEQNSGCILAHCMGLGKTLQVISLLHTVINSKQFETNKILVLCPISTIMNWKDEILRWLGHIHDGHRKLQILELDQKDNIDRKLSILQNWSQCDSKSPAVCLIMGYESFRNLVNFHTSKANAKKYKASSLSRIHERIQNYLLAPADIVICDEGHVIKNNTAAITLAVNQIQTKRRIILTGTPMQNHLMEYYSMVNFVKPNFLGTKQHFNEYFAEPIKCGQHADSCESDIKYMKERSYALNKKLSKIVQRREISLLKDFLPEKFEFVLFVPLTQIQYNLYKYFLDNRGGVIEYKRLFGDYTCLRKIWTHLKVLDNAHQKSVAKKKRATNDDDGSNDDDADEEYAPSGALQMVDNDWWRKVIDKKQLENASSSHKMVLLFEILNECKRVGDKCVIFSSFVEVLNVVEFFMQQIDKRNGTAGLENFVGPWRKNEDYYRLDGSTLKERRHSMIKNFNDVNNTRTKVFLISAQAGGQGINLFGANRLILLDTSWNPARDQQSIFRIYRMGQAKQCYIYRLLSMGTMEEKIYSRSVTKQAMSCRVVDKQQVDRHFSISELYQLYSLTKTDMKKRVAPIPTKDGVLAHLLQKYPNMIFKYLEHDSLLANKVEEELNDIEKREAWQRCQEQNLQMQALNNMISDGQQTVMPFKLHNQNVPALELKERSVVNKGKVFFQHNKENVSNDKEMADSISGKASHMERERCDRAVHFVNNQEMDVQTSLKRSQSYEWLPPANKTPTETSNDAIKGQLLPLENFKNGFDNDIEIGEKGPLLAITKDIFETDVFTNGPSSTSYGAKQEHLEDKSSSTNNEVEQEHLEDKSSFLSDNQEMDVQTSLQRSQSYEWHPHSNETPTETSNDDVRGQSLPLENFENGFDDDIEIGDKGPLLAITKDNFEPNVFLNGQSSTNNEVEHEHSEDKSSSHSDNEEMDVQTSLQRSQSYEWLPPSSETPIETSNGDVQGLLLPLGNGCNDSIEVGDQGLLLAITKDIFEQNVFLKGPSSTSNEKEHNPPEDRSSSHSDNQEMDDQTSLQRSQSYELLPSSNETPIETSNDDVRGQPPREPLEKVQNAFNDVIEEGAEILLWANDKPDDLLNGNEMGHCLSDIQQIDAQPSLEPSRSSAWLADLNALIELSNDGIQRVLLPLENGSNDSLNHGAQGMLLPPANRTFLDCFNRLSTTDGTTSDCCENRGSALTDGQQMDAQTCLARSKSCPACKTSIDNAQGVPLPLQNVDNGSSDSTNRDIQQLPMESGHNVEVIVERSLADVVKGLLHTLNNKYAASSQHPYSIEDYATDEQIIGPDKFNNLEYRIALKRPASGGSIQRPIKRLKLSLEIDTMAGITVDHIMSTLPFTTECQLNVIEEDPQSLKANDGNVRFSDLTGEGNTSEDEEVYPKTAEQSKEMVTDLSPTEPVVNHVNVDVESNETIVNATAFENETDSVRVESTFPVDVKDEKEISLNESTECIDLNDRSHNNEQAEYEVISSDEYMEEEVQSNYSYGPLNNCIQSENEQDSSAGMMSESETSDEEDICETQQLYDEQPSTMARIMDGCALM